MTLTFELFQQVYHSLTPIVAMVYTFIATRRKDVDERFDAAVERMNRHETRILAIEQELNNLPDKEDFHALQITLSEMNGDMKVMSANLTAMSESMSRTESIVTRHEDFLRENK